jgi:hypothetical protein
VVVESVNNGIGVPLGELPDVPQATLVLFVELEELLASLDLALRDLLQVR